MLEPSWVDHFDILPVFYGQDKWHIFIGGAGLLGVFRKPNKPSNLFRSRDQNLSERKLTGEYMRTRK